MREGKDRRRSGRRRDPWSHGRLGASSRAHLIRMHPWLELCALVSRQSNDRESSTWGSPQQSAFSDQLTTWRSFQPSALSDQPRRRFFSALHRSASTTVAVSRCAPFQTDRANVLDEISEIDDTYEGCAVLCSLKRREP